MTGTTEESIAQAPKIGFKTDLIAINPLNNSMEVPVYFANFVLMDYGLGAVFGCPAHDQRDLDFAKKYSLEINTVVTPDFDDLNFEVKIDEKTNPPLQSNFFVFYLISLFTSKFTQLYVYVTYWHTTNPQPPVIFLIYYNTFFFLLQLKH